MIGSAALFVAAMLAESATSTMPAQPDPRDKVTCRRETPIGSLIPGKKTCHTRREWDQIAENARADVDTMRDRASAHPSE